MRMLLVAAVLSFGLVAINASTSSADQGGNVPTATLTSLGISGMQPISDAQGMDIRGKGTRGSCIPSCRPSCQPVCQPKSCESSCKKTYCAPKPVCRPTCTRTNPV